MRTQGLSNALSCRVRAKRVFPYSSGSAGQSHHCSESGQLAPDLSSSYVYLYLRRRFPGFEVVSRVAGRYRV